jgi:hypothetical protein
LFSLHLKYPQKGITYRWIVFLNIKIHYIIKAEKFGFMPATGSSSRSIKIEINFPFLKFVYLYINDSVCWGASSIRFVGSGGIFSVSMFVKTI